MPTVRDRFSPQAVRQVLQPRLDPTFSEPSYGFRPGRSAQQATAPAQADVEEGRREVVDVDVEKFFARVNLDVLMGRLAKRIEDKGMLRLRRRYLEAGVMGHGGVIERHAGTPHGGPRTPPTIWPNTVVGAWSSGRRRHPKDAGHVRFVACATPDQGAQELAVGPPLGGRQPPPRPWATKSASRVMINRRARCRAAAAASCRRRSSRAVPLCFIRVLRGAHSACARRPSA